MNETQVAILILSLYGGLFIGGMVLVVKSMERLGEVQEANRKAFGE